MSYYTRCTSDRENSSRGDLTGDGGEPGSCVGDYRPLPGPHRCHGSSGHSDLCGRQNSHKSGQGKPGSVFLQ